MAHYIQRNLTINEEQKKFIESNHGSMNISQLSKMLGLTYNKCHNNLKLMGLVTPRKQAIIVDFNKYFDVDDCFKVYKKYFDY